MRSHIGNNTDQTTSGNDVGIYLNAICRALVDPEYLEPVTGVLRNDPGTDLFILHIVLVQLIQLAQSLQFKLL